MPRARLPSGIQVGRIAPQPPPTQLLISVGPNHACCATKRTERSDFGQVVRLLPASNYPTARNPANAIATSLELYS